MRFMFLLVFTPIFISACVSSETTTTLNNPNGIKVAFNKEAAVDTRIKLALLYLENKQMQQAKENLDKALFYQPNNARTFRILAYYFQLVNEDEKAEEYYNKSISVDPKNGDTYHNYGTFLCAKGQYNHADMLFLKAVNLPTYNRVAQTYQNAAVCAEENKKYKKAIRYVEHALSHDPNNINLSLFLAKLNINVKNYTAAKLNLFTFQRNAKPSAESLWQWIRLSYATGNEEDLLKHGEQLLKLFPETPQVLYYVNKKYYD